MSQSKIEQIEEVLHNYGGMHDGGTEQCATEIHALFHPVRKPLSDDLAELLKNLEETARANGECDPLNDTAEIHLRHILDLKEGLNSIAPAL